jgi:RNA polymerase sigma-70 factor (ECF subfamily)
VTQDVFLIIHRKLKDFRFDASFKTWLYRVVVNASINYAKRVGKERSRRAEYTEGLTAAIQANKSHAADKEYHEEIILVLLGTLNPDQRACLTLRSVEQLSYQEIADTLNININTVRTRIKRAREALLAKRNEVMNNAL